MSGVAPRAAPAARRHGRAMVAALVALSLLAALVLLVGAALHDQVHAWGEWPLRVVVDGREVIGGIDFRAFDFGHAVVVGFALLLVGAVALSLTALGLLLGLGVPLLVVLVLAAVFALPAVIVLLPLVLLLRGLRRGPRRDDRASIHP